MFCSVLGLLLNVITIRLFAYTTFSNFAVIADVTKFVHTHIRSAKGAKLFISVSPYIHESIFTFKCKCYLSFGGNCYPGLEEDNSPHFSISSPYSPVVSKGYIGLNILAVRHTKKVNSTHSVMNTLVRTHIRCHLDFFAALDLPVKCHLQYKHSVL